MEGESGIDVEVEILTNIDQYPKSLIASTTIPIHAKHLLVFNEDGGLLLLVTVGLRIVIRRSWMTVDTKS